MKFEFSKDYDGLIKDLEKQINDLRKEKSSEKMKILSNLNASCDNCRYGWLDDVGDWHTACEKGYCKLCMVDACDEWEEETDASKYLAHNYNYRTELVYKFDDLFNSSIADASLNKVKAFCDLMFMKE